MLRKSINDDKPFLDIQFVEFVSGLHDVFLNQIVVRSFQYLLY